MIALQPSSTSGALDKSSSTPFPFRTGLTSANRTEPLQAFMDKSTRPPGEGNATSRDRCKTVPQNHSLLENDLKGAVSSFLPKKASDGSLPNSELLPFLQNLCSQVNHLRVGQNSKWQENVSKPREGIVGVAWVFYLKTNVVTNVIYRIRWRETDLSQWTIFAEKILAVFTFTMNMLVGNNCSPEWNGWLWQKCL